jgi:hypothetical protein
MTLVPSRIHLMGDKELVLLYYLVYDVQSPDPQYFDDLENEIFKRGLSIRQARNGELLNI